MTKITTDERNLSNQTKYFDRNRILHNRPMMIWALVETVPINASDHQQQEKHQNLKLSPYVCFVENNSSRIILINTV